MNTSSQSSSELSSSDSEQRKHYDSIDTLFVEMWDNIRSTGDLNLLVIHGEYSHIELQEIWFSIDDEFTDEFGRSENYTEFMELKKEWIIKKCELELTGDRFLNTELQILAAEMNSLMTGKSLKFGELVAHVSKYMSFRIKIAETSVREFYNYIKIMSDGKRV